jgi:hypothetical protein
MRPIHKSEIARYEEAYLAMSAFYRPAAPSDGFGHITTPLEDLDLHQEARDWAIARSAETDTRSFFIGVPNYNHNRAFLYAIELARMCCSSDTRAALRLLALLTDELHTIQEQEIVI